MPDGTHRLGPDTATLRVRTQRQGLAAKAGHDLVIEVGAWEATLTLGSSPALALDADATSLQVREGLRGIKPLTDKDRAEIRKNIDSKVLGGRPISFRSTSVAEVGDGTLRVSGDLTMAGSTQPASFAVRVGDDGAVSGGTTVVQTRWGIKPYTGLMGALKVADEVHVEVEGRLHAA